MGECRQQKHTQHAPSTKMECDYLNGWIKKRSHSQESHPKVVNPRDIAGERKKKQQKTKKNNKKINKAKKKKKKKTTLDFHTRIRPFSVQSLHERVLDFEIFTTDSRMFRVNILCADLLLLPPSPRPLPLHRSLLRIIHISCSFHEHVCSTL